MERSRRVSSGTLLPMESLPPSWAAKISSLLRLMLVGVGMVVSYDT